MSAAVPSVLICTTGGMLLTLSSIRTDDLAKTVVLSAVGACVSFMTAALLGWLFRRRRKDR